MSDSERVAAEVVASINARDHSEIERLTTTDVQLRFPPRQVFYGRDGVRDFMEMLERRLPQLTIAARRIYAGDDFAVVEFDESGRTVPGSNLDGMGAMVLKLEDGRVARCQLYLDTAMWEAIAEERV
jgi:ketosteroid isomerase-like protein